MGPTARRATVPANRHNGAVTEAHLNADHISEDQAKRYAQHVAPTFMMLAKRAVELAEIEPGHSVLDACTGTGLAAFLAAERAGREGSVIGLDAAPAMLAIACERSAAVGYEHIHWQEGDAHQLSYADESFDSVLCVQALMLVPRPDAVLEEVRRVLVEGGRFVATLWGSRAGNEWTALLEDALRRTVPGTKPPTPFGLSQPGNLEVLLQATGYEEIEVLRVPDRMRFHSVEGFWDWCLAVSRWRHLLAGLPEDTRERFRAALERDLDRRVRGGEVAIEREIVYARAVAPPST